MLGRASSSKGNVWASPARRGAGDGSLGHGVEDAGLTGPDLAQILGALPQFGGDGAQVLGPLFVAEARPRSLVEGLASGTDSASHVGLLRLGHAEEELLAGGVDHVDHVVRRRLDPLAADEELIRVLQGCADVVGDGHGVSNRGVEQTSP
jgi:hypothetical protein